MDSERSVGLSLHFKKDNTLEYLFFQQCKAVTINGEARSMVKYRQNIIIKKSHDNAECYGIVTSELAAIKWLFNFMDDKNIVNISTRDPATTFSALTSLCWKYDLRPNIERVGDMEWPADLKPTV